MVINLFINIYRQSYMAIMNSVLGETRAAHSDADGEEPSVLEWCVTSTATSHSHNLNRHSPSPLSEANVHRVSQKFIRCDGAER
jgi:hypothetical protein